MPSEVRIDETSDLAGPRTEALVPDTLDARLLREPSIEAIDPIILGSSIAFSTVTARDKLEWDEKKLISIPGFGRKSLNEINNFLDYYKLKFIEKNNDDNLDIYIKEKKFLDLETISINILTEWPLSVRTFNALKQENIIFLGDLFSYNENSLLKLKNFFLLLYLLPIYIKALLPSCFF